MTSSISSYIEEVTFFIEKLKFEYPENIILFRGQNNHKYLLKPSIYRENRESYFEYDVIHFLKSSKFVKETSDLEIAIQAQHFGYPTRLLDVSYNSLVALFFACYDPNFKNNNTNGLVSIISIPRFFPPTSTELLNLYTDCIKYSDIFNAHNYFNSPILIENIKNNDRIIAQHGAFLLFLNNKQIIENYERIEVSSSNKAKILEELNEIFNINEGSLFPDIQKNVSTFNTKNGKNRYIGSMNTDLFKSIKMKIIDNIMSEFNEVYIGSSSKVNSSCVHKTTQMKRYKRKMIKNLNILIPNALEEKKLFLGIINEQIESKTI